MHRLALAFLILTAPLSALALFVHYAGGTEASSGVAWRSIGPGQFGAMFGVAISPHDPNVIVAGVDMGNAFMTRDGGKSWRILGRNGGEPFGAPGYRGCWGVCFDPRHPERIWIGSSHGLFLSTDSGDRWRLVLGGGAGHTIHAITTDPTDTDIVYAASGVGGRNGVSWAQGAIWKTTDGGRSWRDVGPKFPGGNGGRNWVTITLDPQSPSIPGEGHGRVYACGQAGFFVSLDAGQTWSSLEESLPVGAAGSDGGVPTSGICDMTLVTGELRAAIFATFHARFTDPEKKRVIGGVYASYDGGRTWVEKNKGLEAALVAAARYHRWSLIKACSARPEVMYWAGPGGVFRSDDGGGSWRNTVDLATDWVKRPDFDGQEIDWLLRKHGGNFDQSYYNDYGPTNGLACSANDPNAVAYTDNAGMGLSYDGGRHWTEPGFEFGDAVWPGQFGDRPPMLLTHKVRSRGLQLIVPNDAAIDPFDPKTIAIGHDDIGLMVSHDDGNWWEWAYTGILNGEKNNIRAIVYDPQVRGRMWVAGGGWDGSGHVNESDDGGRTFGRIGIPQLDDEVKRTNKKHYVHALALAPDSPVAARTLYAGTDLGLFKTTDGGKTWASLPLGLRSVARVRNVTVNPMESHRVYAAVVPADAKEDAAGLYRSDDAGAAWRRLGPGVIGPVRGISECIANGTLYVIAHAAGQSPGFWSPRALWRSDDHGTTWVKLDDRLGTCVAVHPRDPNRVYYVTFAGDVSKERVNAWRSLDGGKSWTPIADDIALTPGGDGNRIVFDPKDPSRFLLLHNSGTYEGMER